MHVQTASIGAHFPDSSKSWSYLASVWRKLATYRQSTYRPEKHYMRGPGPKCREKQARRSDAAHR